MPLSAASHPSWCLQNISKWFCFVSKLQSANQDQHMHAVLRGAIKLEERYSAHSLGTGSLKSTCLPSQPSAQGGVPGWHLACKYKAVANTVWQGNKCRPEIVRTAQQALSRLPRGRRNRHPPESPSHQGGSLVGGLRPRHSSLWLSLSWTSCLLVWQPPLLTAPACSPSLAWG